MHLIVKCQIYLLLMLIFWLVLVVILDKYMNVSNDVRFCQVELAHLHDFFRCVVGM